MHALLLAGGFGTRLQPVTGELLPKPLVAINGEPFLLGLLRHLRAQGVTEATLCVHHQAELIMETLGNRCEGMTLRYSVEDAPLGTGGALKRALEREHFPDSVLALNADCFVATDLGAMMHEHRQTDAALTIALAPVPDCRRYGEAVLDLSMRRITAFRYPGGEAEGWVSTGYYMLKRDLFDAFELPERFSFESDVQRRFAPELNAHAWTAVDYFIDIGVPEDYARAQRELPERMGLRQAA